MALTGERPLQVSRLAAFGLTSGDASALVEFYARAFGCRALGVRRREGPEFEALMDVPGGADVATLALGDQRIEITQFDLPGRAYRAGSRSSDLAFQHFAIVVEDMDEAYRLLSATPGWRPISTDGPQRLPDAAGGVSAFKFRDPEGHPLELLAFPKGAWPSYWRARQCGDIFLGIDHSALSVSDSARSIRFYQALGLSISGQSINSGPAQEQLDAIGDVQVEVTALSLAQPTPHIELLGYSGAARRRRVRHRSNDIAASRLVFEAGRSPDASASPWPERGILDPDGHHLTIKTDADEGVAAEAPVHRKASPRPSRPPTPTRISPGRSGSGRPNMARR